MKRFFFSVIALSAIAISCTKSGLVELPQTFETPITFEPYTGKAPTTKATVMDSEALQDELYDAENSPTTKGGFHVLAFTHTTTGENSVADYTATPYMDEDVWYEAAVTDDPETADVNEAKEAYWDYNGVSYWPEGKLDFVAYGLNAKDYMAFTSKTSFTYAVPALVSAQEDLIVATPQKGETNDGSKINIPFKHLLSKVGFSLETNNADQKVKVTIKKIVLSGAFHNQGVVDMTADTPAVGSKSGNVTSYTFFGMQGADNSVVDYNPSIANTYDCFVGDSKGKVTDNAGKQVYDPIYANHTITVVANPAEDGPTTFTQTSPVSKTGASEDNRYMMIIPTDAQANAKITVVYQLTGDEERTAEAQLANTFKFEAGMGYEFVLKVSTLKVDFSVNVSGWDPNVDIEESYTLTPVTPAE
ncbi:MAG: fimbrillin family protein [Bacteroidales bacterium]|nr:fimbrillin family protein [Bacteroidales bacterium]